MVRRVLLVEVVDHPDHLRARYRDAVAVAATAELDRIVGRDRHLVLVVSLRHAGRHVIENLGVKIDRIIKALPFRLGLGALIGIARQSVPDVKVALKEEPPARNGRPFGIAEMGVHADADTVHPLSRRISTDPQHRVKIVAIAARAVEVEHGVAADLATDVGTKPDLFLDLR